MCICIEKNCISYFFNVVQLSWLGMEKDPPVEPYYTFIDGRFLVHSGDMVWMGLLFLYRLALAGEGENGFI